MARKPLTYEGEKLHRVTLRLAAPIWERAGWMAEVNGTSNSEICRRILTAALKDVVQPSTPGRTDIQVSAETREKLDQMAEATGMDVGELVAHITEKLAKAKQKNPPADNEPTDGSLHGDGEKLPQF